VGFLFFLLYLTAAYLHPGELLPQLAAYHFPIWLGLGGLAWSIFALPWTARFTLRALPLCLMAGLLLSMMASLTWAERWLGAPLHVLQVFGPALTIFLLAIWNITTLRRARITAGVLVGLALMLVAQSVAAYHYGFRADELTMRGSPEEDLDDDVAELEPLRVRSFGDMNDPNDLALVLVASLGLVGFAWKNGRAWHNAIVLGVPGTLLVYGVYLTRSRGGMLGVLAVLFIGLMVHLRRSVALVVTVMMAVLFMAANFTGGRTMSASEESAAGRLDAWSEGLDMYRSNPILGVGFQEFSDHHTLTAHNSFVLCFAELGTIGYFFWLALLASAITRLRRLQLEADPDGSVIPSRYALSILAAIAGILVTAFFLSRSYNPVVYLLVAFAFALFNVVRASDDAITTPLFLPLARYVVALEFGSIIAVYALVRVNRLFLQ